MVELSPEEVFLSSVRNAFVLLIAGLAIYEFGGRLSKISPVFFILVAALLGLSLYNYWTRSNKIGLVPWVVLVALGVIIWLIYESWKNPDQLFTIDQSI